MEIRTQFIGEESRVALPRRWLAAAMVFALLASFAYAYKDHKKSQAEEVIANLEIIQNMDILLRDDFDKLVKQ